MTLQFLPNKPVLPLKAQHDPFPWMARNVPRLLDFSPMPIPRENVVLAWAHKLGFETVSYSGEYFNIITMMNEVTRLCIDMNVITILIYTLFHLTANAGRLTRRVGGFAAALFILSWPFWAGTGTINMLNFLRTGISFRTSLLAWDIMQIRDVEEVKSWSYFKFISHLWLFPMEENQIEARRQKLGYEPNARIECLKQIPEGLVHLAIAGVLLFFVPPASVYDSLDLLPSVVHNILVGFLIYLLLSSMGVLSLSLAGFILGIEQQPMFQNPLGATRVRVFWSRWNRAIATVLHRVIFGGKNTHKTLDQRRSETKGVSSAPNGSKVSALRQRVVAEEEKERSEMPTEAPPKKRRPFLPMAALAVTTFFVSGLFHEYLIFQAFHANFGYNTAFFLLNGFATVLSSAVQRYLPSVDRRIHWSVRYALMWTFYCFIVRLFLYPFIAANFFASFQKVFFELIIPRKMERPKPMFIYLFRQ
ncbi:hypothetical protein MVES1_001575 [Malassezia vespertilionis]|uniref:Wax synthase domain-containing protein n=1 Tax=Malassezia vespertilionis TaxID=2020962 RepID=A0A2N1JD62_9BASI|nr:uncharacterized protein MVES1_001575 [Malassezia vespertilionis]PKI84488.1 hypothetical protein MVES_001484 [Malassezia vespertilionis]WFD06232.1 hypothetical protein MVES1_001575 [Malassezia vespertilionis]